MLNVKQKKLYLNKLAHLPVISLGDLLDSNRLDTLPQCFVDLEHIQPEALLRQWESRPAWTSCACMVHGDGAADLKL